VASSVIGGDASKSAANQQSQAASAAAAQSEKDRQPWLTAGAGALDTLKAGLQPGGQFNTPFTMADATNSTAEQHALSTGLGALNNSAASKGQLLGTNNQQQNIQFAEDTAAGFQNQAFNQWMAQQSQQLDATQSLAQVGQTEANQVGDTNANAILAAGGAQAGATAAQGNIYGGLANSLGNIGSGYSGGTGGFLSSLFGTGTPATTNSAGGAAGQGFGSGAGYGNMDLGENLSDERLKEDVHHIGYTKGGTPIYRYKLKGGGRTQMGVMAQDVEKTQPHAVRRHASGYKMVDYDQVT
jgi:hypothetical protein